MMKSVILIISFFGLSMICIAQKPSDVSINELIGKVKHFDERSSMVVQKNGKQKEEKSGFEKSLIFDEKGRVTLALTSGISTSETRYIYEKNGISKAIT